MIILYHKLLSECRWNDTPNDLDQDDLTVVGESQFVQQNPVVVSQCILVVVVNSQMCQSRCHEILVTAPEMREKILVF